MAMTMTQKILAAHAGLDSVEAGQLILVNLDLVLGNDITSPVAIKAFKQMGKENVFDKEKVTMVMDHFAPNKDIKAAQQCMMCRNFCGDQEITMRGAMDGAGAVNTMVGCIRNPSFGQSYAGEGSGHSWYSGFG